MAQFINTLSITDTVNDWLANSRSVRILHVFDPACNLINENRDVISIVTPEIGNGPFNLVVESDVNLREHLSLESPVSSTATKLQIGNLTVQTQNAKIWNPCPEWETLRANKAIIVVGLKSCLSSWKSAKADSSVLNVQSPHFVDFQFSNSLPPALAIADLASSINAAQNLAGLGHGLTPSGDDFMMGAIYAAWIIHPRDVAETLATEIANTAAPLTTSLSGAWLRSAAKGEAGILWHRFLDALISGDPSIIEQEKSNILSIGATSGADALAGFIQTFIAFMEIEKKHVLP